jgi:hypothetical protein
MLHELGLRETQIVDRMADLTAGIQPMRDDFGAYYFDEANCAEGLRHLGLYRRAWNDRLGCWRETPQGSVRDFSHWEGESGAVASLARQRGFQPLRPNGLPSVSSIRHGLMECKPLPHSAQRSRADSWAMVNQARYVEANSALV